MVNPVLSRPSEVWMPSHRSRPIGNADMSGHRILASRSTIRQADSRDRPEPRAGGMESVPSISDPGRSRNVRTQFTPDDARRYYDRFGWRQDTQGFYENPAIDDLVIHADFEHAPFCAGVRLRHGLLRPQTLTPISSGPGSNALALASRTSSSRSRGDHLSSTPPRRPSSPGASSAASSQYQRGG